MKEIKGRTLYACDFCGKRFQMKHHCLYHEVHKCFKNPENRHKCLENGGCRNLERKYKKTTEYNYDKSEYEFNFTTFECAVTGIEMYTYRLKDKLRPVIGGTRMPLQCDNYKENQ
jgi:hypothetical protein